jgi:catechol 1,2-dioxygenase
MHRLPAVRSFTGTAALVAALLATPAAAQSSGATPNLGTGPNHRAGAPFRAKLSPPLAAGTVLLVQGAVMDAATGKGISGAVLDAYQAGPEGYDMDGYEYRARVMSDEQGRFEFETVVPSNYGPPPHIHVIVTAAGYRSITTEIRFRHRENPTNNRPELTPELVERTRDGKAYFEATFDVKLQQQAG